MAKMDWTVLSTESFEYIDLIMSYYRFSYTVLKRYASQVKMTMMHEYPETKIFFCIQRNPELAFDETYAKYMRPNTIFDYIRKVGINSANVHNIESFCNKKRNVDDYINLFRISEYNSILVNFPGNDMRYDNRVLKAVLEECPHNDFGAYLNNCVMLSGNSTGISLVFKNKRIIPTFSKRCINIDNIPLILFNTNGKDRFQRYVYDIGLILVKNRIDRGASYNSIITKFSDKVATNVITQMISKKENIRKYINEFPMNKRHAKLARRLKHPQLYSIEKKIEGRKVALSIAQSEDKFFETKYCTKIMEDLDDSLNFKSISFRDKFIWHLSE